MLVDNHALVNTILFSLAAFLAFNTSQWKKRKWFASMLFVFAISNLTQLFSFLAYRTGKPVEDIFAFDLMAAGRSLGYLLLLASLYEAVPAEERKKNWMLFYFLWFCIALPGMFRVVDIQIALVLRFDPVREPLVSYFYRYAHYLLPRIFLYLYAVSKLPKAITQRHVEIIVIGLYAGFEFIGDLFKTVITDLLQLRIVEFQADPWFQSVLALSAILALIYRALQREPGKILTAS